nr:MAG TPA: Uroporphyrinogen-III methylase [Inoviridae sp.]
MIFRKNSARLIRHGRAADTPCAVISNGTRQNQTVATGVLSDLQCLTANAATPALIVIGEVAALHHRLAWFQSEKTAVAKAA